MVLGYSIRGLLQASINCGCSSSFGLSALIPELAGGGKEVGKKVEQSVYQVLAMCQVLNLVHPLS